LISSSSKVSSALPHLRLPVARSKYSDVSVDLDSEADLNERDDSRYFCLFRAFFVFGFRPLFVL